MENLEIEVKFLVDDATRIRDRILQMGGVSQGSVFERNIRFEDANGSFQKAASLLRLRKDRKSTLTLKIRPEDPDTRFKIHKEYEVEISDFEIMIRILEELGYHQAQVYEKYREMIIFENTHLCIDRMPYGLFLEIEGSKENIKTLADKLGLAWKKRILLDYITIFERLKKELSLPFTNITFDNFNRLQINPEDYGHLLC
jgi:adenylate cyclase class 2